MFNTTIGPSAEGDNYYSRTYLDQKFWKLINNGAHILVSAPRRIGKTSFLKNVVHQGKKGFIVKYHITESINSSNEFFKRLYKSLLEELSTHKGLWKGLQSTLKQNSITKLGTGGIEFGKSDLDYFEEFKLLIIKIDLSEKLIFIVDEFSETLENIITDHGEQAGKQFLHQNRELRQESEINKKIQFVYSGSIGLGNIAERINSVKNINDVRNFTVPPLTKEEGMNLIKMLTTDEELDFAKEVKNYLLERIFWLIPYYLQIVLDEIENVLQQNGTLKVINENVDQAIDKALEVRIYFEHWLTRLRTAIKGDHFSFAKETLNAISKSDKGLSVNEVFDLASKYGLQEDYGTIVRTLEYDGYIHANENKRYIFNSPLLRIWWERNIAI
ncbi:MAG: hypothetical protein JXR03_02390 [Cyclobacteriaceae bacterium]